MMLWTTSTITATCTRRAAAIAASSNATLPRAHHVAEANVDLDDGRQIREFSGGQPYTDAAQDAENDFGTDDGILMSYLIAEPNGQLGAALIRALRRGASRYESGGWERREWPDGQPVAADNTFGRP
jgi:hypothetical protein